MQTSFKRHQKVRLLAEPDSEYVEYDPDYDEKKPLIAKGTIGKINLILPNGQYHVEIINEEGKTIAYAMIDEEFLEPAQD